MTKSEDHRARSEHERLREIVGAALRRADPIGLIAMGARSDEYDPELGTILPRLVSISREAEMEELLYQQFVAWFGPDEAGTRGLYSGAAREIWEQWLVLQGQRLSGEEDVEVVRAENVEVRHDGEPLSPLTILRFGSRYFVEARSDPGNWWMGERHPEGYIVVWSTYGPHREAFQAH